MAKTEKKLIANNKKAYHDYFILDKIETREVKHRLYGYFGSFTWAGAAVKNLAAFGEKMKWEVVGVPVEQKQALKADKYEECWALGEEMAKKLKTEN